MPNLHINLDGLSDKQVEILVTIANLMRSSTKIKKDQAREEFGRIWNDWKEVAPIMDEDEAQALVEEAIAEIRTQKV